jgi:hypothetical protein
LTSRSSPDIWALISTKLLKNIKKSLSCFDLMCQR